MEWGLVILNRLQRAAFLAFDPTRRREGGQWPAVAEVKPIEEGSLPDLPEQDFEQLTVGLSERECGEVWN